MNNNLHFSRQQLKIIGNESFISRAILHLSKYDESFASLSHSDKLQFTTLCKDIAINGYGLSEEITVMTYLLVSWVLGPDFASIYPNLGILLRDTNKTEIDRGNELHRQVMIILEKEG